MRSSRRFGLLLVLCVTALFMLLPSVASAVTQAQEDAWMATAAGRYMNPDGAYGYQCVDVPDDYCIALWGNYTNTLGTGDAGWALFNATKPGYFTKILNNTSDPNQIPQHGDIVFWQYPSGGGHVAVVDTADVNGMMVYEQNYYLAIPGAKDGTLPCALRHQTYPSVIGWLRPILATTVTPGTLVTSAKPSFSTKEDIVITWTSATNATKYGLSVWKPPYWVDSSLVFDQYVTGNSKDIGTLPAGNYAVNMKAYNGSTGGQDGNNVYFSVVAPETTPPTTTSNATTTYVGKATIRLTAVDNAGGSGVAHTYYRLDGGAQTEGTTIVCSGCGAHTIEFWSVDAVGNSEQHKTASFVITASSTTVNLKAASALALGRTLHVTGSVTPRAATGSVKIYLYRLAGSTWKLVLAHGVGLKGGGYAYSCKPQHAGRWRIRAHYLGSTSYKPSWTVGYAHTTVK